MEISLLGIPVVDSPFTLVVSPGEIEPSKCTNDITAGTITMEAGMTHFFEVSTFDIYDNALTEGIEGLDFDIIADY